MSVTTLRYMTCEWCGRPAGGELLCTLCTRSHVWAITNHDKDPEPSVTQLRPSLLQERRAASEVSLRTAAEFLGRKLHGRRRTMGGMRLVREEHETRRAIVAWPEAV